MGATVGMKLDVYDVLSGVPWCKSERPMPSDEQLMDQIKHGKSGG